MGIINHICKICNSWMLDHITLLDYKKCLSCGYTVKKELKIMDNIDTTVQHMKAEELNPHNYPTTLTIDANLIILLDRINKVRNTYNKPMIVTSGLRSDEQQQALIAAGKSNASKSHHLVGEAVDIQDSDGELAKWVKKNLDLMEKIGMWMEDFDHTNGWVHFQIVPPKSNKRVFIP